MKTNSNPLKLVGALAALLAPSLPAVTFDNGGGDSTWENNLNWDTDTVATGSDTIVIPAGFDVTRASLLRLTNEAPGTLDIQDGATLTITGDLQLDQSPAAVNIAGSLIFASGGTKSNMDNGATQGTYTLSGLLRFEDYNNGIASSGNANSSTLLDFVAVGATMEALQMSAADFSNLNGKFSSTAKFFSINGTQVNNSGTASSAAGADIVDGLYLARTDTADSVTVTLAEVPDGLISLPEGVLVENDGSPGSIDVLVGNTSSTSSLDISDITVTGTDASLFSVTSPTALTIAPEGSSTITLSFTPGAVLGNIDAQLDVVSDTAGVPGTTSSVPITGSVRNPWISTLNSIDLGTVLSSGGPVSFSVTVSNIGSSQNLDGEGVFFTGTDAASLDFVTDFTQSIAPGGSADVDLTFDPSGSEGSISATIELDSNDPVEGTRLIAFTANVVRDPVIALPEFVVAGPYTVGVSGPQSFEVPVENFGGSQNLTLSPSPSLTGGDAAFFSVSGFDASISPGGAGVITVDFTPPVSTRANYSTTLVIESNDALAPTAFVEIYANVVEAAPSGLVARFPFEEGTGTTTEDSVSGMFLSTDSAIWEVPTGGLPGSAAALDFSLATNPATRVDDTPGGFSGIAGSADRTVTAWVRTTNTGRNVVVAWGASFGGFGDLGQRASFLVNSGALRFEIGGGFAVGTANIADGEWHHIAISTTGTDTANTVMWVDGAIDPVTSFGNANPIDSIARWVTVGGGNQPGGGTSRFQGSLDEVRVYDRVLTASEIAELANVGTPTFSLEIAGYNSVTGILSITADSIPVGQTFHLKQSVNLQTWGLLSPALDFTSATPQPFEIPVDPETNPKLFFQAFAGPSNP